MSDQKKPAPSENKSISIGGDVRDSNVIIGDHNTVNQTIIQKFFNIFKSDAETLEQRNRRILLNHVENAWIKGVLDASLYGAAMLDLGLKETPEAINNKYPWTLKKESTDETLPAGTSMLEIFDSIGMGRSLLILGAPGSGKTTMLLELARGLIARAREDITQPIPMVFNLASWTEKLTLADWLAQELNNLYSVPRKTAPDWVKGDKLLLLLDGLDEVRQDSRVKCVEAINDFRKQNGLTSLAVCSRSQDYADLKAKLSFEGAVEVQPLTQKQITEFFNRFRKEMAGIKQALEKDSSLREMAETPLFLSIMIMAYRDKQDVAIIVSGNEKAIHKHLFDTYIERMFNNRQLEFPPLFKKNILYWLSRVAQNMILNNQIAFFIEDVQINWFSSLRQKFYFRLIVSVFVGLIFGVLSFLSGGILLFNILLVIAVSFLFLMLMIGGSFKKIKTVDILAWDWNTAIKGFRKGWDIGQNVGMIIGIIFFLIVSLSGAILIDGFGTKQMIFVIIQEIITTLLVGGVMGIILGIIFGVLYGIANLLDIRIQSNEKILKPGQRILLTGKNILLGWGVFGSVFGLFFGLWSGIDTGITNGFNYGVQYGITTGIFCFLFFGFLSGLFRYGGLIIIQHYTLRFILARNNLLPWRLVPFLDHCVDLIFLRRVGGGYIFIHRLLMEHFAEMYVETPTSKGNQE